MTYEAVIRRQAFKAIDRGHELYPVGEPVYGPSCGHAHKDAIEAAICVDILANRTGLQLYGACIVRPTDGSALDVADNALLWGLYETNRKAGATWPT